MQWLWAYMNRVVWGSGCWEIVAHNAGFDALFFMNAAARTGMPSWVMTWGCTKIKMQVLRERGVLPAEGSNSLNELGKLSGFWNMEKRAAAHDALQDARCCKHGMLWLLEKERGAGL
jgi:DNA polymerase III epsilon subunit-like protein